MFFYKAIVQYNGHRYFGWQKQKHFPTIQGEIEKVLRGLFPQQKVQTLGASRTDARVHALGQVVKITLGPQLDPQILREQINTLLPLDIRILVLENSSKQFKVINHAHSKDYLYFFSNNKDDCALQFPLFVNFIDDLDFPQMQRACSLFVGVHHFHNYQYKDKATKNMVREIFSCQLVEDHEYFSGKIFPRCYCLKINGTGFLKQMVRLIMGTLINVGRGVTTLEEVQASLEEGSALKLGFVVQAHGLYLLKVNYWLAIN